MMRIVVCTVVQWGVPAEPTVRVMMIVSIVVVRSHVRTTGTSGSQVGPTLQQQESCICGIFLSRKAKGCCATVGAGINLCSRSD